MFIIHDRVVSQIKVTAISSGAREFPELLLTNQTFKRTSMRMMMMMMMMMMMIIIIIITIITYRDIILAYSTTISQIVSG